MVRSTFQTIYAGESTGLSIMAARKAVPRTSRHVRAQQLRPAILLKWPRNRQRARIQTLGRPRAIFPFLKARHERWSCSVSASTVAKWAERLARAAMVRAARAHLWGPI